MNQESAKTKENVMGVCNKNTKKANIKLFAEVDDVMMEAWAQGLNLGQAIDTMPQYLREVFLGMSFGTPVKSEDGEYTITLRI
jgi:hypothetical protein